VLSSGSFSNAVHVGAFQSGISRGDFSCSSRLSGTLAPDQRFAGKAWFESGGDEFGSLRES
jgi:hypothetical protein